MDNPNSGGMLFQILFCHLTSFIVGVVIHQNDLEVLEGLGQNRIEGWTEKLSFSKYGDNNRDLRG